MNLLIHRLTLNMHSSFIQKRIFIKSLDTCHALAVTLTECSERVEIPTNATVQLVYKLPSGTKSDITGTLTDNIIYVDVPRAALTATGNVECQIRAYWTDADNNTHTMTSQTFLIVVEEVIYDSATMSTLVSDPTLYETIVVLKSSMQTSKTACDTATASANSAATAANSAASAATAAIAEMVALTTAEINAILV